LVVVGTGSERAFGSGNDFDNVLAELEVRVIVGFVVVGYFGRKRSGCTKRVYSHSFEFHTALELHYY